MPRPVLSLNSVMAIAIVSTSVNLAFAEVRNRCIDARQSDDIRAGEICQSEWRRAQGSGDTLAAAQALFQLAILARRQGEFTRAENHLQSIAMLPGIERDWPTQYRLSREQGILAHVQRRPAQALSFFRSAQSLARLHDDQERVARSLNDLGNAYRHIGANRQALDAFIQSLAIKRQSDDRQLGTTLNNIADLLVDLGDAEQAENFYLQALEQHRRHDDEHHLAHSLESMAHLAMLRDQPEHAAELAGQALLGFQQMQAQPDQVRLATLQARIAWSRQQVKDTDDRLALARDLANRSDVALPPAWYNIQADRWVADHRVEDARDLLVGVEPTTARWPIQDRLEMLARLAELDEQAGNPAEALRWHRAMHEQAMRVSQSQRDQDLTRQRVLLEVAEHQRDIERLQAESTLQSVALDAQRARTLSVGLAGILGIGLVVVGASSLQRRRTRQERRRRAKLEATLAGYRQAASALRTSHGRLQQLFDASNQAMIGLGPDDRVVMANSAACRLLGLEQPPVDQHVDRLFQAPVLKSLQHRQRDLNASTEQGRELLIDLEPLALEEELQVIMLRQPETEASEARDLVPLINRHFAHLQTFGGVLQAALKNGSLPSELEQRWKAVDSELQWLNDQLQPVQEDVVGEFRQNLVELMIASLAVWEKHTGLGRVDLAEKSRIWRVTVDEGRLRTRAMDRYLSLAKLPRQPRWREVLRTAYFVLGECSDPGADDLETRIARVQQAAQRLGLT